MEGERKNHLKREELTISGSSTGPGIVCFFQEKKKKKKLPIYKTLSEVLRRVLSQLDYRLLWPYFTNIKSKPQEDQTISK